MWLVNPHPGVYTPGYIMPLLPEFILYALNKKVYDLLDSQ